MLRHRYMELQWLACPPQLGRGKGMGRLLHLVSSVHPARNVYQLSNGVRPTFWVGLDWMWGLSHTQRLIHVYLKTQNEEVLTKLNQQLNRLWVNVFEGCQEIQLPTWMPWSLELSKQEDYLNTSEFDWSVQTELLQCSLFLADYN